MTDKYDNVNESDVLKKISKQFGVPMHVLKEEMDKRIKVLNWMVENKINDYIDVAKIIKLYYVRSQDLMDEIG